MTRSFPKVLEGDGSLPKTSKVFLKDLDLEGVFLQNLHTVTKAGAALAFPSPSLN